MLTSLFIYLFRSIPPLNLKRQPSLHVFSEPLPAYILTSDQVRQVSLFRATQQYRYPQREGGGGEEEGGGGNPIWEINSQHPTEPVLGSLAHSVLSYPLVSCSKAKHVFDTRLEGIWRRYRFLLCFTLHRESVCVCQGWDFFSLPPSLPPSFLFSLIPLPSSPAPLPPPPNTKSVNHKPFFCYHRKLLSKSSNCCWKSFKPAEFEDQRDHIWTATKGGYHFRGVGRVGKGRDFDRKRVGGVGWGYVGEVWLPLEIFLNPLHQLFSASWGPSPGLLWG